MKSALWVISLLAGFGLMYLAQVLANKPVKPCPGEVGSMVIDKDGAVLCTYMLVPQGVVTKKEKQK